MKIGLIKEYKEREDNRVALTPKQCMGVMAKHPDVEIYLEPSDIRCFTDDEYDESGVKITDDMGQCDVLLGIKEVPKERLIGDKTYLFFSHTIKKQPYNQPLLRALVDKGIRMIDYEGIVDPSGGRVLGFGHWAGVVGAHNGLLNYGKKTGLFELPAAHSFTDFRELQNLYEKIDLPAMRIAVTGSGRVSAGALQIMELIMAAETPLEAVGAADVLAYGHFSLEKLYIDAEGGFDRSDFFEHPERYSCTFRAQSSNYDLLINGIFWNQKIDRLFEAEDIAKPDWSIQSIADISCDIDGSVPINLRSTDIQSPSYGVHRASRAETAPYLGFEETVDVMAVDNLPNELPRDASKTFGEKMASDIIPELLKSRSELLQTGTLCEGGKLTERYAYLTDYYTG